MKRKFFLTIAFLISLIPMVANQFGTRGLGERGGWINLINPICIIAIILFLIGTWFPFKKERTSHILSIIGVFGIVAGEIVTFLCWYCFADLGDFSMQNAFHYALPEFYLGLVTSTLMVVTYFCTICAIDEAQKSTNNRTVRSTTSAKRVSAKSTRKTTHSTGKKTTRRK